MRFDIKITERTTFWLIWGTLLLACIVVLGLFCGLIATWDGAAAQWVSAIGLAWVFCDIGKTVIKTPPWKLSGQRDDDDTHTESKE